MAKIFKTLADPLNLFPGLTGKTKLPDPAPVPAPVTRKDTAPTGTEVAKKAAKRRGRASTILNAGGETATVQRKQVLGGGT